jgi:tRNA(Ile)-lysidine synthase
MFNAGEKALPLSLWLKRVKFYSACRSKIPYSEFDVNRVRQTIRKVRNTISRYDMISHGDSVVVAVSGGPDSVCLLDILYQLKDDLGLKLVVAHLDHGLRPDEDEAETRFVKSLAGSLQLPFETKKAGSLMEQHESSLEERARDVRYRFLEEALQKFSARKIAVGHNLNDQAETVLMRLIRGSGPSGLAGIPPLRDEKIIRPLIEVSRNEVESYIEEKGLKYVTDISNLEPRYLRNSIRLDLLPQLRKYQPRIVELLGQTAGIMRKDEECLEEMAKAWVKGQDESGDGRELRFHLSSFKKLPEALKNRVIRYALRETGGSLRQVGLRHIEAVKRLAASEKPQAMANLPNHINIRKDYDALVFGLVKDTQAQGFCCFLDGPGTFYLDALRCTISLEEMVKSALAEMNASPWTAFLSAEKLAYPLMIRNFLPGDRFVPLGMSGHKKLKDFFIDLKLSSRARAQIPILTHSNRIVWVCGLRIDDRFKVTDDTEKVLKVTLM